jgi:uracil-DNA glycosylase family 4
MTETSIETKKRGSAEFDALVRRVRACRLCPRMADSARVIGHGSGPNRATVMFVGEAPGRLGADGSQVPFHGDKAGHNFEALLDQVGLSRYDAFITNAVLCNPKDESGNNATPSPTEIANCAQHLREQLRIVDPKVVVTLGAVALKATDGIERHSLTLKEAVRTSIAWAGRTLIPLYHPGQRAMIHRSFANQLSDYQYVSETVRRWGKTKRKATSALGVARPGKVGAVVRRIVERKSRVSYFALHKLLFLAEVRFFETTGRRLSQAYIIRQKDGPYCVDLHPAKLQGLVPDGLLLRLGSELFIELPTQLGMLDEPRIVSLSPEEERTIDEVVARYADMSHTDLKRASYLAKPMRSILRRERLYKENLFNAPLFPAA